LRGNQHPAALKETNISCIISSPLEGVDSSGNIVDIVVKKKKKIVFKRIDEEIVFHSMVVVRERGSDGTTEHRAHYRDRTQCPVL
jgi:hypothetical protein